MTALLPQASDLSPRPSLLVGSLGLWSARPEFFPKNRLHPVPRAPLAWARWLGWSRPHTVWDRLPWGGEVPERLASFLPLEYRSRMRAARHALPRSPAGRRLRALDSHCPARPRIMAPDGACAVPWAPAEASDGRKATSSGPVPAGSGSE